MSDKCPCCGGPVESFEVSAGITGIRAVTPRRKTFIEVADELMSEESRARAAAKTAEMFATMTVLTPVRIRELRANYAERTLKGNRSDLFGTDHERDELCRLALAALGE